MSEPGADERFERVVQKIDSQSKLLRAWELKGGVSAQVTALEIERSDSQQQKMIVRRHGLADPKQNPEVAADEFKLLQTLQSLGLAVPKPYHLDQSCEIFPTPYVVIEYVEGTTEFEPSNLADFIVQLATHLARIHSVDRSHLDDLAFLPRQEGRCSEQLRKSAADVDEARIRAALRSVWPLPERNAGVLLHGDFWPGNTLWKDGRLVAVIDWEDAALGDPLADLANCRLEILWAFGSNAMDEFTRRYRSMMAAVDFTDLPSWDLCADLRLAPRIAGWGLDDAAEERMRERHRLFFAQAFDKLRVS